MGRIIVLLVALLISFGQCLAQSANIEKVWVDYDTYENGNRGMRIHIKFDVSGARNQKICVRASICDENHEYIRCNINGFRNGNGYMEVYQYSIPKYDNSIYSDFKLFIPSYIFQNSNMKFGTYNFFAAICIVGSWEQVATSDWYSFTYASGTPQYNNSYFINAERNAASGDRVWQSTLGIDYYLGRNGIPLDYNKAVYWLQKAANQDETFAIHYLGRCYYGGLGVQKDYKKAVDLFTQTSHLLISKYYLAMCYNAGFGVTQDLEKSAKYFKLVADNEDYVEKFMLINSQFMTGVCYYHGNGVQQDYYKAKEYFEKAIKNGDTNTGTKEYLEETKKKIQSIATTKPTAESLQEMWDRAEKYDGEHNYDKARELFQILANQGVAEAQYNLGLYYYLGEGVPENLSKAVEWFEKAANQGDAKAQSILGLCYYLGNGVPTNLNKAVEWFEKAANQGDAIAQSTLGLCYYLGEGVPKNLNKAVEWFEKAANQGDADAQYYLGFCYYAGQGVSKDWYKAFKWLEKSANQGNEDAEVLLTRLLY